MANLTSTLAKMASMKIIPARSIIVLHHVLVPGEEASVSVAKGKDVDK
jgi:hypothetical protein